MAAIKKFLEKIFWNAPILNRRITLATHTGGHDIASQSIGSDHSCESFRRDSLRMAVFRIFDELSGSQRPS